MVPVGVLFSLLIYDNGHMLSIRAQWLICVWLFATPGQVVDSGTILDLCMCSVTKSGLPLCHPMDCSTSGFPILHHLPEFAQIHVHWVGDATQPSYFCYPLLLSPSIFPSIRVFSNESVLCISWPKYWSFSFSISPSSEYSGLISFRTDWSDVLPVQSRLSLDWCLPSQNQSSTMWKSLKQDLRIVWGFK